MNALLYNAFSKQRVIQALYGTTQPKSQTNVYAHILVGNNCGYADGKPIPVTLMNGEE